METLNNPPITGFEDMEPWHEAAMTPWDLAMEQAMYHHRVVHLIGSRDQVQWFNPGWKQSPLFGALQWDIHETLENIHP